MGIILDYNFYGSMGISEYSKMLSDMEQNKRCLNLMRMIIVQGLIDVNAKTKNKIRKSGKKDAKKFFKKKNKYFLTICKLANVDPNYILDIYKKIKSNKNRKSCLIDTLNMEELSEIFNNNTKDYYNFLKTKKGKKNDENNKK